MAEEVPMTLLIASLILQGTLVASQPRQAVAQMGRVSGQVVEDGTNTPVAGARVFAGLDVELSTSADAPRETDSPRETVTDRDGRYRLDGLPAGRYYIAAEKAGFAPPMEPSTMQRFEVFTGQALDGLTVVMRRGGVFTGRVLDSLGQPLANAGVTALLKRLTSNEWPAGPAWSGAPLLMPSGQSQTNDLGEFRIFGLSAGEYVIVANLHSGFGGIAASSSAATMMTSTYFPGTADVSAAQAVTVKAGETVSDLTIRLVTVPAFHVSGVVVDERGAPVEGAMVMLMRGRRGTNSLLALSMGPEAMSPSDASGRFTFGGVPAGSYTVRASGGGGGFFATSDDFIIDGSGTPREGPPRRAPAPEPGTIDVTIENANVSDLKLVVSGSPF
jgi:protocatechuate 3,4-dioxygenase beta subunit